MNTKKLFVILVVLTGSVYVYAQCPSADLTGDCRVDMADLAVMATEWMREGTPLPDDMVFVPGGGFSYQKWSYAFVDDFAIGRYEVTLHEYCEFLNATDQDGIHWHIAQEITRAGSPGAYTYSVNPDKGSYPIRWVNYYDAVAYADWRSILEDRSYRLPTEQEWEKAAGWDPHLQKHWDYGFQQDTIDSTWCRYGLDNTIDSPLWVGSFNGTGGKNNAHSFYGCYDMSGNVSEWTSSWLTVDQSLILRGGWYAGGTNNCLSWVRQWAFASTRTNAYGFRLALDLD